MFYYILGFTIQPPIANLKGKQKLQTLLFLSYNFVGIKKMRQSSCVCFMRVLCADTGAGWGCIVLCPRYLQRLQMHLCSFLSLERASEQSSSENKRLKFEFLQLGWCECLCNYLSVDFIIVFFCFERCITFADFFLTALCVATIESSKHLYFN